jgi:hypothetical protein
MPKFLVPITRDITETTWVDVEAASALEARDKALDEVLADPYNFNFTVDDGQLGGEPYFAGDDDLESIEEEVDA